MTNTIFSRNWYPSERRSCTEVKVVIYWIDRYYEEGDVGWG